MGLGTRTWRQEQNMFQGRFKFVMRQVLGIFMGSDKVLGKFVKNVGQVLHNVRAALSGGGSGFKSQFPK